MTVEEFKKLTSQIAQNLSNQGLVTTLLTQLEDNYTQEATTKENLTKQVDDFTKQVDDLQKANMNLYLKASHPTPDEKLGSPEPLRYEDLIKDFEGGNK